MKFYMKLFIIGAVVGFVAVNAFGVAPSWKIDDEYSITKATDKFTKTHTYVLTQDGKAFTGLFTGGVFDKLADLLKGSKYTAQSCFSLNNVKFYVALCERDDKYKTRCFVRVMADSGDITFICNVDEPKIEYKERIVEKIVYIEKGSPIPKPIKADIKVNVNGLYHDNFEEYYNHKYKN